VDGHTGFIVPPQNPLCLAEAVVTLLKDPERARVMSAAGRVRAREHFSDGLMVSRLEGLYRALLSAKGIAA
jgi:glycosyltransferase involved in cell wall biosynthesis